MCCPVQALANISGAGDSRLGDLNSPHYSHRMEVKQTLARTAERMVERHNRSNKAKVYDLWDIVGLRRPEIDAKKAGWSCYPCIIVEVLQLGYRLRSEEDHCPFA
jgi:hypothetical protein